MGCPQKLGTHQTSEWFRLKWKSHHTQRQLRLTSARIQSNLFRHVAKNWSSKTEINFVTDRTAHNRARSELWKHSWLQWMIKPFSHWCRSHPAFSDKLTGWFLTNHCLATKGFFYCKVGDWEEVSDSSLVWDTVCAKGMSQDFTGAGLLDGEHNPSSSQGAQKGTREPWALRRGFPEEMGAPATSKSSPIPSQFPASMNQKVDFSKPILVAKTIPLSYLFFFSINFCFSSLSIPFLWPALLCFMQGVDTAHRGGKAGWNRGIIKFPELEGSSKSCTGNPQQSHHVPRGWREMERQLPVCPALTLWNFGGAGKGLELSWGIIFAPPWQLLPAWLLSPHPRAGCTSKGLWLSWKTLSECPVPNTIICRLLLVWLHVLSSRNVLYQSIW